MAETFIRAPMSHRGGNISIRSWSTATSPHWQEETLSASWTLSVTMQSRGTRTTGVTSRPKSGGFRKEVYENLLGQVATVFRNQDSHRFVFAFVFVKHSMALALFVTIVSKPFDISRDPLPFFPRHSRFNICSSHLPRLRYHGYNPPYRRTSQCPNSFEIILVTTYPSTR